MPDSPPEAPRRRRRWGRRTLIAVCIAGAIAVLLIATIHPWWIGPSTAPQFVLDTMNISFSGSASAAVEANSICGGHCPVTLGVGATQLLAFTVTPVSPISNCSPKVHYSVTKVTETSTGGAFPIASVSADEAHTALPVTIPNPLGGRECVLTAQIWVTFDVVDEGASHQIPQLKVTVT
ncbi:MAG: hypothetical protein WAK40_04950 [Thermoplasmata archaeon]